MMQAEFLHLAKEALIKTEKELTGEKRMIDRRTNIGKMIDKDRVVYQCIKCNKKFVGDMNTNTEKCPFCKWKDHVVILENMSVIVK